MSEEFGSISNLGIGTCTSHNFTFILVLFILLVIVGTIGFGRC